MILAAMVLSPNFYCKNCLRVVSAMRGRLRLHGAIYRPDSFVLMLSYCVNLKAIRYESTTLNRIAADKSYRVIAAEIRLKGPFLRD